MVDKQKLYQLIRDNGQEEMAEQIIEDIENLLDEEVEKITRDIIGFVNSLPDCGDVCSTQEGCFGCLFKDSFVRFFRDNKYLNSNKD